MSLYTQIRSARTAGASLLSQCRHKPHHDTNSPLVARLTPHQSRRSLHFDPTAITEATQSAILTFHSFTGLSWAFTIPLISLTVNALFRLPFNIYTQRLLQRRGKVAPILQTWTARISKDLSKERAHPDLRLNEVWNRHQKVSKGIYKRLGLQGWRLYLNLISFPFWILGIDAVRRLCGGPRGLLGGLMTGSTTDAEAAAKASSSSSVDAAAGTASTTTSTPLGNIAASEPATSAAVDASTSSAASSAASEAVNTVAHSTLEPSLATEGMLWFQDLTAADPYCILPFALSTMLVANVWPKNDAARASLFGTAQYKKPPAPPKPEDDPDEERPPDQAPGALGELRSQRLHVAQSRWRTGLYRGSLLVAAGIGPATIGLPAALHLYWLSSAGIHWVFGKFINWSMPLVDGKVPRCQGLEIPVIRPTRERDTAKQVSQKIPTANQPKTGARK